MDTVKRLVMRACELYSNDTLAPSIITSWVKEQWYVSVVRWIGPRNAMERKVLFSISGADLETVYTVVLARLG